MDKGMLAECRHLLDHGMPQEARTAFDADRGYLPLAMDRSGEGGAVALLSDRNGGPMIMVHLFKKRGGDWEHRGGGGGGTIEYPLVGRVPAKALEDYLRCPGNGGVLMNPEHRLPWTGWYLRHAELTASAEVRRVRVRGRLIEVPFHGFLIVVWSARRAPAVEALGEDGEVLTTLDVSGPTLH
ncbi:hypothetical protein [Nonomuraea endophytica]|uniref:hypothetical protein n=1 Tax=Nonomuraea endophytica TaxID=714136 RepID=UPI0037C5E976